MVEVHRSENSLGTERQIWFFWLNVVAVLVLALPPSLCQSQVPSGNNPDVQPERSIFVQAPREVLRPLLQAARAIEENDPGLAAGLLGQLLSEQRDEDYLVPVTDIKGAEGVNVSLHSRAQQLLGSLTTKDRAAYRLRYGTRAKLMLAKAVEDRDFDAISQVMQQYFYTEAGYSAAMLLGHFHLDEGRTSAAAACFQRIADEMEASRIHDPEASVLLATCWMLSDLPERAGETLLRLKQRFPGGQIEFDGKQLSLFSTDDQALPWLQQLIGSSALRDIGHVDQWMMFGGNSERNARSGNGFPLNNPRWVAPTVNDPDLEKAIVERQRELIFLDAAPIPSLQPLVVGDTIVMRAFDRMYGVDFKTGKRVWVFPPWDLNRFAGPANLVAAENESAQITSSKIDEQRLTERLWQDSLYGQASSDGSAIFVVPNPGFADENSLELSDVGSVPLVHREFNELKAVEIGRQGAFKWEVGGVTGLDEPKLAKTFFLGPPLPLDGVLYSICQQEQQIKLVELDPKTGLLLWSQQLVSVEAGTEIADARFRRLAGATPSFADGILVCPTGAGALVAIDLATHSLLWGYQFANAGQIQVSRFSPNQGATEIVLDGLWRDSSITIGEGCVVYTPVDSQNLVCVDLQTGFPKWTIDEKLVGQLPRGDSLYVACIEFGKAILVGRDSIRAIQLVNGQLAWELKTEEYGRPSGRGYANRGKYHLPMTSEQLLQVDLQNGELTRVVTTIGVLGNLVCFRDEVISHGVDRLASFPQDQPSRERIRLAEEKGVLTAEELAIKSQLQFQDGKFRDAAQTISTAYDQSANPAFAGALADLIIKIVESDFDFAMELASRYDESLFADRKFDFMAAKIEGLIRKRELQTAYDELLNLCESTRVLQLEHVPFIELPCKKYDQQNGTATNAARQDDSSARGKISLRLDCWIASQLQSIVNQADDSLKNQFRSQTNLYLKGIANVEAIARLETYRIFPASLIDPELRLRLSEELSAAGEFLRARQLLDPLSESEIEAVATSANRQLATIFQSCNLGDRSQKLTTEFPNPAAPSFTNSSFEFLEDDAELEEQVIPNEVATKTSDSPEFDQFRLQFYDPTGEVEVIDSLGNTIHRFLARHQTEIQTRPANNYFFGEADIMSDLVLLAIGSELLAFDWLKLSRGENPLLWNRSVAHVEKDQSSSLPEKLWGTVQMGSRRLANERKIFAGAPSPDGICFVDGTNLICVNSLSGSRRWQRTNLLPRSMVFGDREHVVVWHARNRLATIFEIKSGRQIKELKIDGELGALWTNQGIRLLLTKKIQLNQKDDNQPDDSQKSDNELQVEKDSYAEVPENIRQFVGLYDLLDERFVWQRQFPFETKACLIENKVMTVLPPTGDFEFLDLASGEVTVTSKVGLSEIERAKITGVGASLVGGNYLVHLQNSAPSSRIDLSPRQIIVRNVHYYDAFWAGNILSIDAADGKHVWEQPVRFDNFQVAKNLPSRLPVYMLVRRYDLEDAREHSLQFVMLDLQSGKLLANISIPYEYRNYYRVIWHPDESRIEINFANKQLNVKLETASDFPPRPVASLTNESSFPLANAIESSSQVDPELIAREMARLTQAALQEEIQQVHDRVEEARLLQQEK